MMVGYAEALTVHAIDEQVPPIAHFSGWLHHRTGWSMSCGWGYAIKEHVAPEERTERFFEFLDEFRALTPTVLFSVTFKEHHVASEKYVQWSRGNPRPRPLRVEMVEYEPGCPPFLRYIYSDQIQVGSHLELDAWRRMEDEFGVARHEWKASAR